MLKTKGNHNPLTTTPKFIKLLQKIETFPYSETNQNLFFLFEWNLHGIVSSKICSNYILGY